MLAAAADDGATSLVDWVCARAAANRSVSRCKPCEWFRLEQLHRRQLSAPPCSAQAAKLAWFMCLTPGTDEQALGHLEYVQSAIVSARLNAPTLAPHVILVRRGRLLPSLQLAWLLTKPESSCPVLAAGQA